MRLLIMADGRSIHTLRWRRYFQNEGWTVALFTLEPDPKDDSDNVFMARRPTGIGLIDYRLALGSLRNAVGAFNPDLISAHYVVSYGWLASHIRNIPKVVTAWGSDLLIAPQRSFLHRMRIIRALHVSAFCTVDNRNLKLAAEQYMSSEKIVMAPMGIDRAWFDQCRRTEFRAHDPLRIIAPRGLSSVYDPETIVEAARQLKGRFVFVIYMFGAPDMFPFWESKVAALGLAEIVKLKPFIQHADYLRSLTDYDVYLSASRSDSTSVALLEAMAAGLYPVVSDVEGNREWVVDNQNGTWFTAGSPESLAQKLVEIAATRQSFPAAAELNRARIARDAIWQDNMAIVRDRMLQLVS